MAEALATVVDLEDLHRPLTDAEKTRAARLLDKASTIVRVEAGETWADPAAAPDMIREIVLDSAWRGFENPSGFLRERIGSYEYQLPAQLATLGVYLTEDERRLLLIAVGKEPRPLGLKTPTEYRMDDDGAMYVPVEGTDEEFPMAGW